MMPDGDQQQLFDVTPDLSRSRLCMSMQTAQPWPGDGAQKDQAPRQLLWMVIARGTTGEPLSHSCKSKYRDDHRRYSDPRELGASASNHAYRLSMGEDLFAQIGNLLSQPRYLLGGGIKANRIRIFDRVRYLNLIKLSEVLFKGFSAAAPLILISVLTSPFPHMLIRSRQIRSKDHLILRRRLAKTAANIVPIPTAAKAARAFDPETDPTADEASLVGHPRLRTDPLRRIGCPAAGIV